MAHGSRWHHCTAQREDASFCEQATVPDAPFPICVLHLAQVAEFLTSLAPDSIGYFRKAAAMIDGSFRYETRPLALPEPVVYYMRLGQVIKIGTSYDVKQRMSTYPPHRVLMATEPGGFGLESRRHRQFNATLAHGKEWFHPSVALIQHINSLREQPLTAAELAA